MMASILDPLQASGIFCGGGAFFYNGILEFLVFLGKLAGNGLETLLNAGLVLFLRVLYHVVLIGTNDVPLDTQDLIICLLVTKVWTASGIPPTTVYWSKSCRIRLCSASGTGEPESRELCSSAMTGSAMSLAHKNSSKSSGYISRTVSDPTGTDLGSLP